MKFSPLQIVVVAALLGLGVLLAYTALDTSAPKDPDAFLKEVRRGAGSGDGNEVVDATLPPITQSPTLLPKIRVEPAEVHAGPIPNDAYGYTSAMIHNDGGADLIIRSIETECNCTEGQMADEQMVIKPGASGKLDIRLNPYIIPTFETTKNLSIRSNDPRNPLLELPVNTKVTPEFRVEPPVVDFGDVAKGESATVTLHVTQEADYNGPFEVTGVQPVEGQVADFEGVVRPVPEEEWATAGKAEFWVDVSLLPGASAGNYIRYMELLNTTKRVPEFKVAIEGRIETFYRIESAEVVSGGRVFRGISRPLSLHVSSDEPIEITDLSTSEPHIALEVVPGDTPHSFTFQILADRETEPGDYNLEISFTVRAEGHESRETRMVECKVADI